MSPEVWLPLAFILGYLLGSIPFGVVLTKVAGTQDLRSIGSGNIGATNVLRTGRKGVATYIGVLIGLFWPAAVLFCLIWLATAVTTRYSSLSALVAAFATPLFLW